MSTEATERTLLLPTEAVVVPQETAHHLQLWRSIIYQATSIISTVDGICGTFALQGLRSKQILAGAHGATLDITDAFIGGALLTLAGGLAGAACGIMFLVLMLHPSHRETTTRVIVKEAVFGFFSIFFLVASIISTVILATGSATLYIPHVSEKARHKLIIELGGSLAYKDSVWAILFIVLGWVCFLFLGISFFLVSRTGRHVLKHGPANVPKGFVELMADRVLPVWVFQKQ